MTPKATAVPLTSPDSFLQPCEAGRTVFLPVGPRGMCHNRRMLKVTVPEAARTIELCSDHAAAVMDWRNNPPPE